jgi:hypothetical protein
MGHLRLGEKMSRQRLCGDVLLASIMRCRPFVFVKFYHSPRHTTPPHRQHGLCTTRQTVIRPSTF